MKSASEKARNAGYASGQRPLYDSNLKGIASITVEAFERVLVTRKPALKESMV